MYLGPVIEPVRTYTDKYVRGVGTIRTASGMLDRTLERYQCEACGAESRVLGKASAPFYCRCGALVALTDARHREED